MPDINVFEVVFQEKTGKISPFLPVKWFQLFQYLIRFFQADGSMVSAQDVNL